jgi:hypothetical protein
MFVLASPFSLFAGVVVCLLFPQFMGPVRFLSSSIAKRLEQALGRYFQIRHSSARPRRAGLTRPEVMASLMRRNASLQVSRAMWNCQSILPE